MPRRPAVPPADADPLLDPAWAEAEFGAADLGDARRTARLVDLATTWAAQPSASFPDAARDPAHLQAAYRFLENDAVEPAAILAAHTAQTRRRCADLPVVLAVQDTTELDYTHHPRTTGLGMLGDTAHHGLFVHGTLALTPERLPVGLLALDTWTRDPAAVGKQATRRQRPTAEKESGKWLRSLDAVNAAARACPTPHFVSVGDREADVFDLLAAPRAPRVDLLVRAAHDRRVDDPEAAYLWTLAAQAPMVASTTVDVPARRGQPARTAQVQVHLTTGTLRPPRHRQAEHQPPVTVTAVWAVEPHPPAGATALDWLLLTTLSVTSAAEALEVVAFYRCRWGIEVWHKVLKSGCRIEARQLEDGAHLRRALAVYAVIAWRLLYLTLLARVAPEAPCTLVLEQAEWQALWCTIHHLPTPPPTPPTLGQALRWIATLGGFIDRPGQGEPGVTTLWKGLQHLADLTRMYRIMTTFPAEPLVAND